MTAMSCTLAPTLDDLFRRTLARQPEALALVDPADKLRVCGQPPLRLTYAEADRAIAGIAAHFTAAGLAANAVIAVQLPNTIEAALTILAAHRVGLIVAVLPQLWRQADLAAALNRTGARAFVASARIDGVSHADLALNAAAEAFSIRHVCGFGANLPEGMASLDTAMRETPSRPSVPAQDGRRPAVITFDTTPTGIRPIPRSHAQLVAGGLAIALDGGAPQNARIVSAIPASSFAGLSTSLTLWLLSGGTLALHHPFDGAVLERQIAHLKADVLVAPAGLALRLGDAEERLGSLRHVLALWRAPEQVLASAAWTGSRAAFTDVYALGEVGLFAVRRSEDGQAAPVKAGPIGVPHNGETSSAAGELILTPNGTLAVRGPMVPLGAYRDDAPRRDDAAPIDYVDTGYAARIDKANGALCINAPPAGVMGVGGYRFLAQDLQAWGQRLGPGTLLTALPDRLSGYRLAGRAKDNARAREALTELGLNPLMVEAFRDSTIAG